MQAEDASFVRFSRFIFIESAKDALLVPFLLRQLPLLLVKQSENRPRPADDHSLYQIRLHRKYHFAHQAVAQIMPAKPINNRTDCKSPAVPNAASSSNHWNRPPK